MVLHVWAPFVNVATRDATVVPIVIGSMSTMYGIPNDEEWHDDRGEAAGWWGRIGESQQRDSKDTLELEGRHFDSEIRLDF